MCENPSLTLSLCLITHRNASFPKPLYEHVFETVGGGGGGGGGWWGGRPTNVKSPQQWHILASRHYYSL